MNALKTCILKTKLPSLLVNPSRTAALWNKDWMPGPYPKTPEERAAAAKKYNLLPEEYEPHPDLGDYPKLPDISGESKSKYYNWDMPELKKDYGEPMHEWHNIISEDRVDINHEEKQLVPTYKQVLTFLGVMVAFFIPMWYFEDKKLSLPHMKKHYPRDGVHYKYP